MEPSLTQGTPATAQAPDSPIETDAVVIGAGPVGLFQVFELGLLEIRAHVVDSLPQPGGQCVELYADKPIYDIPAVPFCTGQQLTDSLLQQMQPFGATLHLGQEVTQVAQQPDGRFLVVTSQGTRLVSKTIFIAGGVGSFQPRKLKLPGIDRFEGTQVFHNVPGPAAFAGQHLVIVGGGDAAVEAALAFAAEGPQRAASVTLVHRRDSLDAAPAALAQVRTLCAAGAMRFIAGQVTGHEDVQGRLVRLQVTGNDDTTHDVPLDRLLVCLGLSPRLGPIAEWGLGLHRKQVVVDTEKFETSIPGIYAVGDIATYPGKKKLILCGFHEATLAAFGAASHVFPDRAVQLQYTTTSPRLHQLLGVAPPVAR